MRQRRQEVRPTVPMPEPVPVPQVPQAVVLPEREEHTPVEKHVDNYVEKSVETVENSLHNPGVPTSEPVKLPMPEPEEIPVQPVEQPPVELPEETPDTAAWRLVGEVFDTYVIVEQGDKTFLIDKHAAHELSLIHI